MCNLRGLHSLRERFETEFHTPGIYVSGRVWVNAWDVFHRTPSRGGRGRPATVDFVGCFGAADFFVLFRFLWGKWSKGGIPPGFPAIWGYRQKRAHGRRSHVPQPASNAVPKRQQEARRPCRARTPFFFFEYILGPNWTAALEGAKASPLLTTSGGGMTPQIY